MSLKSTPREARRDSTRSSFAALRFEFTALRPQIPALRPQFPALRPQFPALRRSLAALSFLFLFFATLAPSASAQSITPGGPIGFGSTPSGTPVSRTLTFVATTSTTVTVAGVDTDGATGKDFQLGGDTCLGTIVPPNGCSITIVFNPTQIGERHGALLITDSTGALANTTILYGVGLGSAFAFAPAASTAIASAPALSPSTFTAGASVFDGNGNLFFTDVQNGRVLEQSASGTVSQVATLAVTAASGIAISGDGSLYVSAQNSVYKFLPGATPVPISTPGVTLTGPAGLALDGYGGLFISDSATGKIVRYSITGSGSNYLTITGLSTPLSNPLGLGVDSNQTLYIVDSGNDRVVTVDTGTGVSAVLPFPSLILSNPTGVTVDPAGTVYVVDTGNTRIVELTVNAVAFALPISGLSLSRPTGATLKSNGDLWIDDNVLGLVLVPRSTPSINFPTPTVVATLDQADDPISLTVQGTGNTASQLVVPQGGVVAQGKTNPSISTSAFLFGTGATCPFATAGSSTVNLFAVGQVCTYPIDFQPTQLGLNQASLVLQTTSPGGAGPVATSTVPLTGNGISGIASFSLVASPAVTTTGVPVGLTLTALRGNGSTAVYYVGTITFTSTDPSGVFLGGNTYQLTAADKGVLVIPASTGIQFNHTGTFTVTASDGTFSTVSNPVQVVNASTATLTSSINPSLVNQSTTFTMTVATKAGTATPTGVVSFYSNGLLLGTGMLVNGVAVLPYAFATPGTYYITASYPGDNNTAAVNAGPLSQTVLYPIQSAGNNFTSSVNPSLVNQQTTLSLTLVSAGPTPTGTVNFYDNGVLLGTATVVNGVASLPASFATSGTHPLTAVYSGDASNAPYTTGTLLQSVLNPDSISLTSSVNPSLINGATTLTATLTTAIVPATGTIKFYDGTTLIGSGTVVNGVVSITVSFSTLGLHPITAVYSGDGNYIATTSKVLQQDVVNPTTAVSFTSSVNPSLVNQSTVLTLTLAGNTPAPTGTVNFYDNGVLIGTGTVSNGVATLTVSFATLGAHPLTAVYTGDTNNARVSATLTQNVVNPNTLTLTSSVNPSLVNQATTLTATLAIAAGTPTGTISFYDGATLIGSGTITNGTVSILQSFGTIGIHPLTAVYTGDSNFPPATSTVLPQDVVNPTTTVSFTSSVNPSLVGQSTVLTLTLAGNTPAPTGTVSFYDNGVLIGTGTVLNGVATITTSFATLGAHPITAVYSGDTYNATVTAALTQIVVNPGTLTLTSSINPSLVGQTTQLTATYSVSGTAPGGSIQFFDGATLLGSGNVSGGKVTIPASFLTVGIHNLTAVFSGDPNYASTTSAIYAQDVVTPTTVVSFTSSVNPSLVNQPTVLTVTLSGKGTTPTGTVNFYDGGVLIGVGTVVNGVATLTTSFAVVGTHQLTAVYSGDTNNAAITAGPLAQVVVNATAITLSSSVNPSLIGQRTNLTATLGTVSGTPSGTITFYDGANVLGAVTLIGNSAVLNISFSTSGIHLLTAVYSGNSGNATATSPNYSQDVLGPITATLAVAPNPVVINQSAALTATLTVPAGGIAPTGTIAFYDGVTLIGTSPLAGNTATLSASFNLPGTHNLTCIYSGDTNYAQTPCNIVPEVVLNPSSLKLSSAVNPSLLNQSVQLTATVITGGPAPTGTVTFMDNVTPLGTVTLSNASPTVTLNQKFTTIGTHPLTALYSGDNNTPAATSNLVNQIVLNPASITLSSSVNPVLVNAGTTLTAQVTSTSVAPTGTVNFFDGTTLLGTGTITNGVASIPASFATSGIHQLTAVYSGDNNNGTVTSSNYAQDVVNPAAILLTSSINPSVVNQSTRLVATVSASGPAPTGTVSFFNGAVLLGTAPVLGGSASISPSFPLAGTYSITAVYSGDLNNSTVTSVPLAQVVLNVATIVLTTSVTPVNINDLTTLKAVVTSTGVPPTGIISFFDGASPIGDSLLVAGVATLPVSFTYSGTHQLVALYVGDANTAPATSNTVAQLVTDFAIAPAAGTPTIATTVAGQNVTYSLVLTPLIANTLTSTVTFGIEGLPKGTVAVFTPATVAAGAGTTGFTLNITAPLQASLRPGDLPLHNAPGNTSRLAPVAFALLLLPIAFVSRRKRLSRIALTRLLLLVISLAGVASLTGCISDASSGYYGVVPQTYNFSVTATAGNLTRTTHLTLNIK